MARQIKLEIIGKDSASAAFKSIGKAASNASRDIGKSASKSKGKMALMSQSATSGLKSVASGFTATLTIAKEFAKKIAKYMGIAGASLAGIGAVAHKLAEDSAKAMEVQRFFAKKFGDETTDSLEKLRKASKGTINDMDLMASSNKAALLGVTDDVEELGKIMEVARIRGKAMGMESTQAFDDLVTGIGRGSPLILDNLGIQIPDAFNEMTAEMTEAERKQKLVNLVLEDGARISKELGGDVLTAADKFAIFRVKIENFKQELGEKLIPIVVDAMDKFQEFGRGFKEGFADKFPAVQTAWNNFIETITEFLGLTGILNVSLEDLGKILGEKIAGGIEKVIKWFDEFYQGVLEKAPEIEGAYNNLWGALKMLGESTDEATDKQGDFENQLDGVGKKGEEATDTAGSFAKKLGEIAGAQTANVVNNLASFLEWLVENKEDILETAQTMASAAKSIADLAQDMQTAQDKIRNLQKYTPRGLARNLIGAPPSAEQLRESQRLLGRADGGMVEKFATGGIKGTDTIPAMLSEGEMVLNKSQQKNLFKMIKGGQGESGTNINFNGDVIVDDERRLDELVHKIEMALGDNTTLELRGAGI